VLTLSHKNKYDFFIKDLPSGNKEKMVQKSETRLGGKNKKSYQLYYIYFEQHFTLIQVFSLRVAQQFFLVARWFSLQESKL
jgi:hypothetical protein